MYNRYVPQPDGTYKKSQIAEPRRKEPPKSPPTPVQCAPPPPPPPTKQEPRRQHPQRKPPKKECDSISVFFKNLLPRDIDIGDLMIILLLLLMAGDCEEDKNTALLTLALYFFL